MRKPTRWWFVVVPVLAGLLLRVASQPSRSDREAAVDAYKALRQALVEGRLDEARKMVTPGFQEEFDLTQLAHTLKRENYAYIEGETCVEARGRRTIVLFFPVGHNRRNKDGWCRALERCEDGRWRLSDSWTRSD